MLGKTHIMLYKHNAIVIFIVNTKYECALTSAAYAVTSLCYAAHLRSIGRICGALLKLYILLTIQY
jgi:hypothetical protein